MTDANADYPQTEDTEDTGLNLFDDRASAVGSFPHAMLGYDRASVDSYVRDIETQVSTLRQLSRHLRQELTTVQLATGDTDFTRLGSHTTALLRAAEAQATELVSRAGIEAERIKEEGRRVAAELRSSAQTEADDIGQSNLANLREMRARLDSECEQARAATAAQNASLVATAQEQAESLVNEATINAAQIIESAEAQARQFETMVRAQIAQEQAQAGEEAARVVADAQSKAEEIRSEERR